MDDPKRDSLLRRVQKLLAIAQDDRANPNEAAAAASQAEKIMRVYQLDMADVLVKTIKTGADLGTEDVLCTAKTNGTAIDKVPPWCGWMAFNLAELHDCGYRYVWVRTAKGTEASVRFYGYTADAKVAAWSLQYLVATVNRLCKQFRDDPRYLVGGRSVMDSYRKGVATGICSKLKDAKREKDAEMQAAVQGRALMVVKQNAIEEKYGAFKYNQSKSTANSVNAFSAGVAVGRTIDVTRRAVGNTADDQRRLS